MSVTPVSTVQKTLAIKAPESTAARTVKSAAVGGVIGAAVGAGLSFVIPFGWLTAPIAAAIGGAAGIIAGAVVGLVRSRTSVAQGVVGAGQLPPAPPVPSTTTELPPALPR